MFTNAKIEQITLLVATERTDRMSAAAYIADALMHIGVDNVALIQMTEPEEFVLLKKETTKEQTLGREVCYTNSMNKRNKLFCFIKAN